jgi:hypothetical protein
MLDTVRRARISSAGIISASDAQTPLRRGLMAAYIKLRAIKLRAIKLLARRVQQLERLG